MNIRNSWMNNSQYLSQIGHGLGGLAIILVPAFLFGMTPVWYILPALLLIVSLKEFWYDLKYEDDPKQTFWDSAMDFGFYMLGVAVGMFLTYIKFRW